MPNVSINGRLMPALQPIVDFSILKEKLESIAEAKKAGLTQIAINGQVIDLEKSCDYRLSLSDSVQARIESPFELASESLLLARQYGLSLRQRITKNVIRIQSESDETVFEFHQILFDTETFLRLAHQPFELLEIVLDSLSQEARLCLSELGRVRDEIENGLLLLVSNQIKDASYVFLGCVNPALLRWMKGAKHLLSELGLSDEFGNLNEE